ncbi:MAG: hypothetical protein EU548_00885 [Promethearchaeota archaeon]|nr:MAG: hypothetical protein EU548_00885 [Candidatus Lokiarchaeota archaeon]
MHKNKGYLSKNISFKTLRKIFFQTSKKRIFIQVLSGIFLFLLANSLFIVWFSYREVEFQIYLENDCDWKNDEKLSGFQKGVFYGPLPKLNMSLYDAPLSIINNRINKFIPGIIGNDYSSAMSIRLFNGGFGENPWELGGLDHKLFSILSPNLSRGRLPATANELLFFQNPDSEQTFQLNETIQLHAIENEQQWPIYNRNYTIVGIITDLESIFLSKNYSADILFWEEAVDSYYTDEYHVLGKFYTSINLWFSIVNNYPEMLTDYITQIDFNYNIKILNSRKLGKYLTTLEDWRFTHPDYYYDFNMLINGQSNDLYFLQQFELYQDLLFSLTSFDNLLLMANLRIIAVSIPLLFIIGLLNLAIFRSGKPALEKAFKVIKIVGLDYHIIRKIILIENYIVSSSSFLGGVLLGFISSLFFIFPFFSSINLIQFISYIFEPFLLLLNLAILIAFFLVRFRTENNKLKEIFHSSIARNQRFTKIREILSLQEIMSLLFGILFLVTGFFGIYLLNIHPDHLLVAWNLSAHHTNLMLFSGFLYFGIIFIAFSIFFFLARLFTFFWSKIGEKYWSSRKNFFSLSLQVFSKKSNNYLSGIVIIFLATFTFIPGLVIVPSMEQHSQISADLQTGCSDILITNWDSNQTFKDTLIKKEEINHVAEVTFYTFHYYEYTGLDDKTYEVNLLAVKSISAFLSTIDLSKLPSEDYSLKDIEALSVDWNYLMNYKYASNHHFDEGVELTNSHFSKVRYIHSMNFVNSYKYFPLLPLSADSFFPSNIISFSLVTSLSTAEKLEKSLLDNDITKNHYLLLGLKEGIIIDSFASELSTDYDLTVLTSLKAKQQFDNLQNRFLVIFLIISSFITIIILVLFGYITAYDIFQERLHLIAAEYRLGAKRSQIYWGFTLELFTQIILPAFLSAILGLLSLRLIGSLFLVQDQAFNQFEPWLPLWIVLFCGCIIFISISGGWFLDLIPQMKKFKILKQE